MKDFMNSCQQKKSYKEQVSYKCEVCSDLGFIIQDNEAIPCKCRSLIEAKRILENSGISDSFYDKTFESFDYTKSKATIDAYTIAKTYANEFIKNENTKNNSIIFMGQSGFGKTHLSISIANYLMKNGVGVVYMNYREDMTFIKQNILDSVVYNKYLNRYKNAKVLVIDDLFKGSITTSDVNIIFELINHRYFHNKPVIISTEKFKSDLLNIDEAIGSRILEMCDKFNIEVRGKGLNYRIYK